MRRHGGSQACLPNCPYEPSRCALLHISRDEPVNRQGVQTFCEASAASSERSFWSLSPKPGVV